ncbi:FG-GAP and VCBS repeat-containing protein [Streptomyces sp. NBC_01304]|uniref:FG-GAP and VCBS repeat-containing protein n=1 Tax=Streptomyces sp. NBC_01304 TaxID=2903818 RepID=UPI002E10EDBB|nr:VCBS repeat-containing protein [Streptomyces sp. NBC_01304]
MRRPLLIALSLTTALTASLAVAGPSSAAAAERPVIDFNGDGFADLAVSAPGGTVAGTAEAGYISVSYGGSGGVGAGGRVLLTQDSPGVPGDVTENGSFGFDTTVADFDGDGYTDLAAAGQLGSVILWGSADGLGAGVALAGSPDTLESGDFNGDGHADLVTDVFPENEEGTIGMTIQYGPLSRAGVPSRSDVIATSDADGSGTYDFVVGDINGDGADEIITSHGFEEMAHNGKLWTGGANGTSHTSKKVTSFQNGVIGDVNGDGFGDFVFRDTGDVWEGDDYGAGNVTVTYGSAAGLSTRTKVITQDSPGVPGVGESEDGSTNFGGDQFGYDLAAGDMTGDGIDDIAVGVPGEDIGSGSAAKKDAGSVVLLKGAASGLSGTGATAFNQSTADVPGASETEDYFGARVLLLDVNNNNRADLAVAAINEDGAQQDSGAFWLFRGSKNGPVTTNIASFGPAALGATESKYGRLGYELGGR